MSTDLAEIKKEYLYRIYEDHYRENTVRFYVIQYPVIKRTPKGAWIKDNCHKLSTKGECIDKRFVLLTARKKFACETIEDAITSFKCRKLRQHKILSARLKIVNDSIRCMENLSEDYFNKPVNISTPLLF